MKTLRKSIFNLALLPLLFAGFFSLNSCSLNDLENNAQSDSPQIQSLIPYDEQPTPFNSCTCSQSDKLFDVSKTQVTSISQSLATNYDFGIKLSLTTDCPLTSISNNCRRVGRNYYLGVDPNYTVYTNGSVQSLSDFSSIIALDNQGYPVQLTASQNGLGYFFSKQCTFYFKWAGGSSRKAAANTSEFETGGICIIDIITDPNGGLGSGGGEVEDNENG